MLPSLRALAPRLTSMHACLPPCDPLASSASNSSVCLELADASGKHCSSSDCNIKARMADAAGCHPSADGAVARDHGLVVLSGRL